MFPFVWISFTSKRTILKLGAFDFVWKLSPQMIGFNRIWPNIKCPITPNYFSCQWSSFTRSFSNKLSLDSIAVSIFVDSMVELTNIVNSTTIPPNIERTVQSIFPFRNLFQCEGFLLDYPHLMIIFDTCMKAMLTSIGFAEVVAQE